MKVKNDFIVIKNGKQEIKIQNTILDTYIEKIIANQIELEVRANLLMYYIFLKFDTELDFDEASILTKDNFDLAFGSYTYNTETSEKEIINNYMYMLTKGIEATEIITNNIINSFENYNGRKLTAIGFGTNLFGNLYACLDVRNYNIYLDTAQVLSVTRRDILSTDAYFYSKDNIIKFPVHLSNGKGVSDTTTGVYKTYYGILKSIGLGHNVYEMAEEHTLLPYSEHIQSNKNSIMINDELTIEYKNEGLFPRGDLFPEVELYPARIIIDNLYPSKDKYPEIDIYPVYSAYQYIQFKYEIYYIDNEEAKPVDTGNYYLLSVPINGKQKVKLNISYERA